MTAPIAQSKKHRLTFVPALFALLAACSGDVAAGDEVSSDGEPIESVTSSLSGQNEHVNAHYRLPPAPAGGYYNLDVLFTPLVDPVLAAMRKRGNLA